MGEKLSTNHMHDNGVSVQNMQRNPCSITVKSETNPKLQHSDSKNKFTICVEIAPNTFMASKIM